MSYFMDNCTLYIAIISNLKIFLVEIEEKIANLTGSKQKIRRDCDKDWTGIKRKSDKSQMVVKQG